VKEISDLTKYENGLHDASPSAGHPQVLFMNLVSSTKTDRTKNVQDMRELKYNLLHPEKKKGDRK